MACSGFELLYAFDVIPVIFIWFQIACTILVMPTIVAIASGRGWKGKIVWFGITAFLGMVADGLGSAYCSDCTDWAGFMAAIVTGSLCLFIAARIPVRVGSQHLRKK